MSKSKPVKSSKTRAAAGAAAKSRSSHLIAAAVAEKPSKKKPSEKPPAAASEVREAKVAKPTIGAAPKALAAEVVVLGSHPACYLAAALLVEAGVSTIQASIPGETSPDRLVLINPRFFDLHRSLGALKRELELAPIHGLRFVSDNAGVASEHAGKSIVGHVASFDEVLRKVRSIAERAGIPLLTSDNLDVHAVNERGVDLTINQHRLHPKLMIVGGSLPEVQKKMLGFPESWDSDVPHRYTFLKLPGTDWMAQPPSEGAEPQRPVMPMSLDLKGSLSWAWLMQGARETQLAVEQAMNVQPEVDPRELLKHWAEVLTKHGLLNSQGRQIDFLAAQSIEFPFAGALAQEGVANRALLVGPAGGFYTACGEDIYPNCWSAIFAAEVASKAIKEKHLQDALRDYREKWGSTLGDYLRGPQQNLRFLLPLVYRNPVMTTRMTEAILTGASVVR
jgi:hypothetical protein